MDLEFLGGADEVGRSALLIDDSLLIDYGIKSGTPPQFPVGSVSPDAVVVSHGHLDHAGAVPALLSGSARPPIHWTQPTYDLAMVLARDTLRLHGGTYDCPFTEAELARVSEVSETHDYGEPFEAAGYEVTFFDAGHIPGSAHVLVEGVEPIDGVGCDTGEGQSEKPNEASTGLKADEKSGSVANDGTAGTKVVEGTAGTNVSGKEKTGANTNERANGGVDSDRTRSEVDDRTESVTLSSERETARRTVRLLYTGDFHTESQALLAGTTARPDADVVVCESTYADTTRPPRERIEGEFVESVKSTVWEGGTVVVPAFAIGRTQEVLCLCERHGIECYVDGMGKRVTELFLRPRNRPFLRDPELLRRAKGNARFVDGRDGQRERIADQNTVIVTTSGMLQGGPAMTYVPAIRTHPVNKIVLTGYQVEGTPGRDLLETGSAEIAGRVMPVSAQVERYDFSAHADCRGLETFLSSYRDATILVTHGDRCDRFAASLREDGFEASVPALGDRITV